jgi:hypothetical protein
VPRIIFPSPQFPAFLPKNEKLESYFQDIHLSAMTGIQIGERNKHYKQRRPHCPLPQPWYPLLLLLHLFSGIQHAIVGDIPANDLFPGIRKGHVSQFLAPNVG